MIKVSGEDMQIIPVFAREHFGANICSSLVGPNDEYHHTQYTSYSVYHNVDEQNLSQVAKKAAHIRTRAVVIFAEGLLRLGPLHYSPVVITSF
jgi:hypothetical protein